jgi:ectoine hydroxylase-related dioxygenase (phytanoyl-CoA dioxygenase family)
MAQVSATEIESFTTDGFVVLRNILPSTTVELLKQGVEKNLTSPSQWANDYTPDNSSGRFFDDYVSWQRITEFERAALHNGLPLIAGELMKTSSPRFFHEHVLVKEPGTATPTPWHHDDPYYGVEGMDNVSLWVPLDSVPTPIALRFIRGSHLVPRRFIPNRFVDDSPYTTAAPGFELFPSADELEELGDTVVCPAEPGDIVAFHFRTLHSAPGTANHQSRRRVVSFRYVGDDVRWTGRPWKTSPPFEPQGLNDGDELDEIRFPLIAL